MTRFARRKWYSVFVYLCALCSDWFLRWNDCYCALKFFAITNADTIGFVITKVACFEKRKQISFGHIIWFPVEFLYREFEYICYQIISTFTGRQLNFDLKAMMIIINSNKFRFEFNVSGSINYDDVWSYTILQSKLTYSSTIN